MPINYGININNPVQKRLVFASFVPDDTNKLALLYKNTRILELQTLALSKPLNKNEQAELNKLRSL